MTGPVRTTLRPRAGRVGTAATLDTMVAAALVLATLLLAWSQMRNGDLWFDEAFSVSESRLPVGQWWSTITREGGNMWAYILLLRPLQMLPAHEAVYEAPSAVFSAIAVVLHFRTSRRWCSVGIAALSAVALLAALGDSQVAEVRSYAAVTVIAELLALLVLDPARLRRGRGWPWFVLLAIAPWFHLLLVFPVLAVVAMVLLCCWSTNRRGAVHAAVAASVGIATVVAVNVASPIGDVQMAWLPRAGLPKTVSTVERLVAFATPGSLRHQGATLVLVGLVLGLALARPATGVVAPVLARVRSDGLVRLVVHTTTVTGALAAVGMVKHDFLSLPDRYGLVALPTISLVFAAAVGRTSRLLRSRHLGVIALTGLVVLSVLATGLRLYDLVGWQKVRGDRHELRRGSAVQDLVGTDMRSAEAPNTVYVISPGVRLEFAVWLQLHPDAPGVAFVRSHLRPFTVDDLARDSVRIDRQWLGVSATRPAANRVAVVDFANGCHTALVGQFATALGGDGAAPQTRDVEGFRLSAFAMPAGPLRERVLVQQGNCALALRPDDGDPRWG